MPRYYFHYRTDDRLVPDRTGTEFPDLDAAEHNAAEIGKAIIERAAAEGAEVEEARSIEITDEGGQELLYVVFWAGPQIGSGPATPIEPARLH